MGSYTHWTPAEVFLPMPLVLRRLTPQMYIVFTGFVIDLGSCSPLSISIVIVLVDARWPLSLVLKIPPQRLIMHKSLWAHSTSTITTAANGLAHLQ